MGTRNVSDDIRDKEGQEKLRNVCLLLLPLPSTYRISPSYPTSMTVTALLITLTQHILELRRERRHLISVLPHRESEHSEMALSTLHKRRP